MEKFRNVVFRPFRIIESETLENKYHCKFQRFFLSFHPLPFFIFPVPLHGSYDTRYATDNNASTSFRWKANPFSAKLHTPLSFTSRSATTRVNIISLPSSSPPPHCIFFHFIIHSFIYFAICLFWDFMTRSSCKFIEGGGGIIDLIRKSKEWQGGCCCCERWLFVECVWICGF